MRGFTLLELMVVVLIVGILAGIAYPAYTDYVVRGKLTEASSALADYRVRLEQYYQDNRNYGVATKICGDRNDNGVTSDAGDVALPTSRYFSFSCPVGATNQTYIAAAANVAGQGLGAAGSYRFTIDQANTRQTTAFTGAAGLPVNCWLTKKGDTC